MASSSGLAGSLESFEKQGYFYDEDEAVGNLIAELEGRGVSDDSSSFELCKPILLANPKVATILKPYLNNSNYRIKVWMSLGAAPGHRYALSQVTGQKNCVVIHMFSPGSKAVSYQMSHVGFIPVAQSSIGLFEVAGAVLKGNNMTEKPITMQKGGVAITDRRYVFEVNEGSAIICDLTLKENGIAESQ